MEMTPHFRPLFSVTPPQGKKQLMFDNLMCSGHSLAESFSPARWAGQSSLF